MENPSFHGESVVRRAKPSSIPMPIPAPCDPSWRLAAFRISPLQGMAGKRLDGPATVGVGL